MNKKFFTLIYGDQLHIAPKTKVVSAAAFSILMESADVLEHIKKDADKYRKEVIAECENIKEKAYKEGYEEGFKSWAEHLVNLEKEAEKIHNEIQTMIIPVALKAAKKIVSKELELSPETIVSIVASNLKIVSQHKKVVIYINKNELEIIEKNKPRLRELFEALEVFSIRERSDVLPGGCVIETEIGIINGKIEHRWHLVEKLFENLIKPSAPVNAPVNAPVSAPVIEPKK